MMEGKPIFCLQFAQLENFKDTYHLNETKSGDRYVQCFPSCPPHSPALGTGLPCKSFCNTTIPVVLGCVGGGHEKDVLSKILLIGEIRPVEASYSITTPSSRTQIYHKCRSKLGRGLYPAKRLSAAQSKALNTGELIGMETQAFEFALDERSICRAGSFEAPSSSTQYVLSVTVMLPTSAQIQNVATNSTDDLLAPVAYFESPTFQVLSSGEYHSRKSKLRAKPRPPAEIGVDGLIEEFYACRRQARAYEHAMLCKTLSDVSVRSLFPEKRKFHSVVHPDLLAEDVLEWAQEEALSASSKRPWFNLRGDVVNDPTATLMQKLHSNSVVEQAIVYIMRHNSLMEESGNTAGVPKDSFKQSSVLNGQEDGKAKSMEVSTTCNNSVPASESSSSFSTSASSSSSAAAELSVTSSTSSALSAIPFSASATAIVSPTESFKCNQSDSVKLHPQSQTQLVQQSEAEQCSDETFGSMTYLRDQFLRAQQNPTASMLDKQFFSDMLHNTTVSTLNLSQSIDSKKKFNYTAEMKFFFSLLADVKQSSRALAIPFLSGPDLPELPALNRCVEYLHRNDHWKFTGSEGVDLLPNNVGVSKSISPKPQLKQKLTQKQFIQQQQQLILAGDVDSFRAAISGLAIPTKSGAGFVVTDSNSTERDDSNQATQSAQIQQFLAIVESTVRHHEQQYNARESSASVSSPGDALAALEMLSLLADRVCSGEHHSSMNLRRKARCIRNILHKRCMETTTIDQAVIDDASMRASSSIFGSSAESLIETAYALTEATVNARKAANGDVSGLTDSASPGRDQEHSETKTTVPLVDRPSKRRINEATHDSSFKQPRRAGNIDFDVFNEKRQVEIDDVCTNEELLASSSKHDPSPKSSVQTP